MRRYAPAAAATKGIVASEEVVVARLKAHQVNDDEVFSVLNTLRQWGFLVTYVHRKGGQERFVLDLPNLATLLAKGIYLCQFTRTTVSFPSAYPGLRSTLV